MRHLGLEFDEAHIRLRQHDTRAQCLEHSPSGKVPVLRVATGGNELVIWDSLAILEYLADAFPDAGLWPTATNERARARSVAAEMHAGFPDLRRDMPMEVLARHETPSRTEGLARDIARIEAIWTDCLTRSGGPFLFGQFTNADAMFAPVASRFTTWRVTLAQDAERYRQHIMDLPAMREWINRAHGDEEKPRTVTDQG